MFYFGKDIKVRVTRSAVRTTDCGHCGTRYQYLSEKSATGDAHAPLMIGQSWAGRRAEARAEKQVRRLLESEPDPVPCPACGHYQADMIPVYRRGMYRWMRTAALGLFVIGTPVIFLLGVAASSPRGRAFSDLESLAASAVAAVIPPAVVYLLWRFRLRMFDPNRDIPEAERLALARDRAAVVDPDGGPA